MQGCHDSDVEFVCQVAPSDDLLCQFCKQNLQFMTISEREEHYNIHLAESDEQQNAKPKPTYTSKPKKKPFSFSKSSGSRDLFWYPRLSTAPPHNFTPYLIPVIHQSLSAQPSLSQAVLCFDQTTHVASDTWDSGWGCGYRNFLMACTALFSQERKKEYWELLERPTPPSVRNLQMWIEDAWKQGYDDEGATQLKRQLVGTSKWIGTADIYVALTSRSVPCRLADFTGIKHDPGKLINWVRRYFDNNEGTDEDGSRERKGNFVDNLVKTPKEVSSHIRGGSVTAEDKVRATGKMPLILQHEGHSRSIVGYAVYKGNGGKEVVELILFDPGRTPPKVFRDAAKVERSNRRAENSPKLSVARWSPDIVEMTENSKPPSASGSSKPVSSASNRYKSPSVSEMYVGPSKPMSKGAADKPRERSPSIWSVGGSPAPVVAGTGFRPLPASKDTNKGKEMEKAATTSKYFSAPDEQKEADKGRGKGKEKEKEGGKPKLVQTVLHPISTFRNKGKGKEVSGSPVKQNVVSGPKVKKRKTPEIEEVVSDSEPERERERNRGKRARSWSGATLAGSPDKGRKEGGETGGRGEVIEIVSSDEEGGSAKAAGRVRGGAKGGEWDKRDKDVRKAFMVGAAGLKKKDKYQILWFPLDPPLDEREKERRKVVTSTKIS